MSIGGTDSSGNLHELLVDSAGHLQVDVLSTASHAVTNAGTFAVQVDGDALTALQLIDDVVGTDGSTGPSKVMSIGGTDSSGNIHELLVDSAGHLQIDLVSQTVTDRVTLATGNGSSTAEELESDIIDLTTSKGPITIFGDFKTADNGSAISNISYTASGSAW